MAKQIRLHTLPMLRPARALDVLAGLGHEAAALAAGGFWVLFRSANQVQFLLPPAAEVDRGARPGFERARDVLFGLLTSVAKVPFDPETSSSKPRDTDDLVDMVTAVAVLGYLNATEDRGSEDHDVAGRQLILIEGEDGAVAAAQSSVFLRCRDLGVIAENGDAKGTTRLAIFCDDNPEDGAMPEGLDAAARAGCRLLRFRRWQFGRVAVHYPRGLDLPTAVEEAVREALVSLRSPHQGQEAAVHEDAQGQITVTWASPEEAAPAVDALPEDHPTGSGWQIAQKVMKNSTEAQDKLNAIISADGFPVGYELRLRRLRDADYASETVEMLQEEVDDLLVRIDLMNALAPQAQFDVLFRFTSRQLGPLVDAMRRLPSARLKDGSVRYANGHPIEDADAPLHYILCPADIAASLATFPELIWAQKTESTPMRFWVDPIWAEYAAARDDTKAAVYVPAQYALTPSLGVFGGDLEETLRLVMGEKFIEIRDFIEDPERAPLFLITPAAQGDTRLAIEVLDANDFVPLALRIKWLNDYLQLKPPQAFSAEDLSSVAMDVYKGTVASEIHDAAIAAEARIVSHWQAFREARESELDAYAENLSTEMAAATDYSNRLLDHLRALGKRVSEMERLIGAADKAIADAQGRVEALVDLPEDLASLREHLRLGLAEEVQRGEALMADVQERFTAQRAKYEAMKRGERR